MSAPQEYLVAVTVYGKVPPNERHLPTTRTHYVTATSTADARQQVEMNTDGTRRYNHYQVVIHGNAAELAAKVVAAEQRYADAQDSVERARIALRDARARSKAIKRRAAMKAQKTR